MDLIKLINLDTKIKKIYNYLVELLKQKGLFDNSLEVQVLNVSCQIYQYQKLINAFVNNFMIAANREKSGKIEAGLLTSEEGTMQIAKISVLVLLKMPLV